MNEPDEARQEIKDLYEVIFVNQGNRPHALKRGLMRLYADGTDEQVQELASLLHSEVWDLSDKLSVVLGLIGRS